MHVMNMLLFLFVLHASAQLCNHKVAKIQQQKISIKDIYDWTKNDSDKLIYFISLSG